jgi:hypothetical protein
MGEFPTNSVREILAKHGVERSRRAVPVDPTEEVLLLANPDFRRVDVAGVVRDLMEVLPHTKVWVVEDGPKWKSEPL